MNNFSERTTPEASAATEGTSPKVLLSTFDANERVTMAGIRSLLKL